MPKGSLPRSKNALRTKTVAGGAQQYVRGKTPMARVMTANKSVQTAANAAERAFRKGDVKSSQRMTKGAAMLERAELAEAKKEMARRAKKKK
jgi:hypothetical protein